MAQVQQTTTYIHGCHVTGDSDKNVQARHEISTKETPPRQTEHGADPASDKVRRRLQPSEPSAAYTAMTQGNTEMDFVTRRLLTTRTTTH